MKKKCLYILQGIFIIILFSSCVTNKEKSRELSKVIKRYTSFEFSIGFLYPVEWNVFESDTHIKISNEKDLLTLPEDLKVVTAKAFLGNLYISDVSELRQLFLMQVRISSKNVIIPQKKFIEIRKMPLLKDVVSSEQFTTFVTLYRTTTFTEGLDEARVFIFDKNTTGIVYSYVKKVQDKNMVFLKTIFLRSINQEYVAVYSADYNTGVAQADVIVELIDSTLFFNRTKDMMLSLEPLSGVKNILIQ